MMPIDDKSVVREVTEAFERYERALLANDVDVLTEMFWDDERVVRFGPEGAQYGAKAVARHRRALARQTLPRSLRRVSITTFGRDAATVWVEFVPDGRTEVGQQSQVWVRTGEAWRVVAAHVSWQGGVAPPQDGARGN